jgi:hypothetical protein
MMIRPLKSWHLHRPHHFHCAFSHSLLQYYDQPGHPVTNGKIAVGEHSLEIEHSPVPDANIITSHCATNQGYLAEFRVVDQSI